MLCAECGALLLDFEIDRFKDICEDCYYENHMEEENDKEGPTHQ